MIGAIIAPPEPGGGPGLIVIGDDGVLGARLAEEGYVVCLSDGDVADAVQRLQAEPRRIGMIGALGFGMGAAPCIEALETGLIDCAAVYDPPDPEPAAAAAIAAGRPAALHVAGGDAPAGAYPAVEVFSYPDCAPGFAAAAAAAYDKAHADIAYSRTLAVFRRTLGPYYDLGALWEAHVACEFATRDADAAMATMVAEPYVNHVPTMIGGYGHDPLKRFYAEHFIPQGPKDRKTIPISRTIGPDRVVQEQVLCFTHDAPLDWMLPGVAPTGRYIEIPLIVVITFRGGKLHNEHIYWDQASVLVQAGLLDPEGLPVAGREQAQKLLEPSRLGGNDAMPGWR